MASRESIHRVQSHSKVHTQRHKARRDGAHGKDAKILAAAKSGDTRSPRKRVFRPVLTSPFTCSWYVNPYIDRRPRIARVDGDTLLNMLVEALTELPRDPQRASPLYTAGINSVTRALEERIQAVREGNELDNRIPHLLFVCVADMEPPTLVAHLPMLTASYNAVVSNEPPSSATTPGDSDSVDPRIPWSSSSSMKKLSRPVILVPLPEGSELVLSTALGIRRLSALLLYSFTDQQPWTRLERHIWNTLGMDTALRGFRLPWLDKSCAALRPVCMKHVASSAPSTVTSKKRTKQVPHPP